MIVDDLNVGGVCKASYCPDSVKDLRVKLSCVSREIFHKSTSQVFHYQIQFLHFLQM